MSRAAYIFIVLCVMGAVVAAGKLHYRRTSSSWFSPNSYFVIDSSKGPPQCCNDVPTWRSCKIKKDNDTCDALCRPGCSKGGFYKPKQIRGGKEERGRRGDEDKRRRRGGEEKRRRRGGEEKRKRRGGEEKRRRRGGEENREGRRKRKRGEERGKKR